MNDAEVLQYIGTFVFRIRRDETSECHHFVDHPEDVVEHTVEVCPASAEHRRVLQEVIGGGDLSRPALVKAMVRGGARRHGKPSSPSAKQ